MSRFIFTSSDKAVNPVNVMGATKRLAELVCQSLQAGTSTQFIIVRFGNVLGSAGSVIPKFREQIAAGGRLRRRYRDLLREEVAGTLADPADVEDEIRALFSALGG